MGITIFVISLLKYPNKTTINLLFYELEKQLSKNIITKETKSKSLKIKIFIGHGRDESWKQLRDLFEDLTKI